MNRTPLLIAVATAVLAFSATREARAVGPIDVEVGAIAGVGTTPSNTGSGVPNPLGFGIGGRGGVSLFGFYGGLEGMYYFGGSQNGVSDHSAMYGVDLGYNIKIANITIRPLLGIGNFTVSASVGDFSGSNSTLYLQPGGTVLVSLGLLYVGADANVLILTGLAQSNANGTSSNQTDIAFTFHGQVGVKF
jgi:hypothetical protein